MQHPDEGTIHTWLDGELSVEDAAAFETHVAECAHCAAAVAEARGLIAGSSRIVSALDSVPAGVIPAARPARRAWYSTTQFRAAAALLLVAGTSLVVMRKTSEDGDKVMHVVMRHPVATDAISPQAPAPAASRETAVTKPTSPSRARTNSSNSAVAAAASVPVEKRRSESPPLERVTAIAMAGERGPARKAAEPRPAMHESAAGTVADESVVGGNALRLVRTDSMRARTQRVFEMPNGVQLIMTESNGSSPAQSLSAKTPSVSPMASAARAAPILPADPRKDQVKFSDYRTITWVDIATGRSYSLTGPFSPDQLEKFKLLVVKLSQ